MPKTKEQVETKTPQSSDAPRAITKKKRRVFTGCSSRECGRKAVFAARGPTPKHPDLHFCFFCLDAMIVDGFDMEEHDEIEQETDDGMERVYCGILGDMRVSMGWGYCRDEKACETCKDSPPHCEDHCITPSGVPCPDCTCSECGKHLSRWGFCVNASCKKRLKFPQM